jgi:hypothetical protein
MLRGRGEIQKMDLDQTYKDVKFETLNKADFLPLIREAFPDVNGVAPI